MSMGYGENAQKKIFLDKNGSPWVNSAFEIKSAVGKGGTDRRKRKRAFTCVGV